jgi:mRNA-degrading endonuclease RelE of RelBE toxin-antitoxin system
MTYDVLITDHFKKQVKRLKKKDREIKEHLINGLKRFNKRSSVHIGKGIYKLRLGKANKGKSGGYRIYILIIEIDEVLVPICIHSKNETENLSMLDLTLHLENVKAELDIS